MDEQQNWREWRPEDGDLDQLLQQGFNRKSGPQLPLMKLKKNLRTNLLWSIVITLAYLLVIIFYPIWQVQLALIITSLFNCWVMWGGWKLYRSIDEAQLSQESLLTVLRTHYQEISAWGSTQLRLAVFVYPVAVVGGYMLGGVIGSGQAVDALFQQRNFKWALLLSVAVLVPVSYFLAKWLFRKSFGIYLDQIHAAIEDLEKPS